MDPIMRQVNADLKKQIMSEYAGVKEAIGALNNA